MRYRVPRLPAQPGAAVWITDLDESRLVRLETVPHGRSLAVLVGSEDGEGLAAIRLQRRLTGTTAAVELGGALFATLSLEGRKHKGAVRVRCEHGEYIIAGDFEAWDFHVLLNTSPVADVAPRRSEDGVALIETSDHEEQLPLLALILAVDLLVQATR
ncbi:MAG: hypothetical protein JW889_05665 [Verrucomicrobia bacterium]|nr:hypothetical protein [Verrucomicrobiota bacterium]